MPNYTQWPNYSRGYYDWGNNDESDERRNQMYNEANNSISQDRDCVDIASCERQTKRTFNVHAPVSIRPYANISNPQVKCEGNAIISPGIRRCDRGSEIEFTITQKVSVTIPVRIGATVCQHNVCID